MILADTDVLIDYLAGIQPVQDQILRYVETDRLQTTVVNCFELLSGAGEGRRGQPVRRLLDALTILPLDRAAAQVAADVRRALDRAGRPIGMGDSLIAGIALANGLPLFTRNRGHFERVSGLKLIDVDKRT